MRTISQRELRNNSGEVLRDLQEGESFEVTVHGRSVGVLRMDPPPRRPQRFLSGAAWNAIVSSTPALSAQEAQRWKDDIADLPDDLDDPWSRGVDG